VEAPKGSLVKLKYEIKLAAFTVSHSLPLGLSYPFDWGFVPSTQAPDGDPLDTLILHEGSTYPGVVLPCRPLGVVEMDQDGSEGKRDRNDRVIDRTVFLEYDIFHGKKTEDLRMEGAEKSLFNH
jgi:inorganic pyrophosphatase